MLTARDSIEDRVKGLESRGLDFADAGSKIHVFHADTDEPIKGLVNTPEKLRRRPATLEDVVFGLTGRSLVE